MGAVSAKKGGVSIGCLLLMIVMLAHFPIMDSFTKDPRMNYETIIFPPVHIQEPTTKHTHTAIILHGRGSSGTEFAKDLFTTRLSSANENLPSRFPGWRWVFPSSRMLWSTAFEEDMPAWFEAHSLTDITARQDLQIPGISESVEYIIGIMDEEVDRLGGAAKNVVLGGISQGAAVGLWTLLCRPSSTHRIGGFIGVSCWLPFATDIENFLGKTARAERKASSADSQSPEALGFVLRMMSATKESLDLHQGVHPLFSTPVFLGHGIDDAYVDVILGNQARRALTEMGLAVRWKEYSGADEEGHWPKEPEEWMISQIS